MRCKYCPLGAVGWCMWVVCWLNRLVMYEQVVVVAMVVQGMLCRLCVHLDAMLELCVRPFDCCELHVAHCRLCIRCVIGDDSVEFERHRPPEHRFRDLRMPHQASHYGRWRCRALTGVLCGCVFKFPCGQMKAFLG